MARTTNKNFGVREDVLADFLAVVERLRGLGADISESQAFAGALLMWLSAGQDEQLGWIGRARNHDLDLVLAKSQGVKSEEIDEAVRQAQAASVAASQQKRRRSRRG